MKRENFTIHAISKSLNQPLSDKALGSLHWVFNLTGEAWVVPSLLLVILTPFPLLAANVCFGKSITDPSYPPVKGSMFNLIFHLNRLYDHQTEVDKTCQTYRLLGTNESYIFTTDVRNIEHIVKTRFENYSKGEYNLEILSDMLGNCILLADGEKWRHQRKLASYEFSTRVARDFSCSVFRKCVAKVVRIVSNDAISSKPFAVQELLMRCTLDSIFKVGFGVELNCLEGSNKEGTHLVQPLMSGSTGDIMIHLETKIRPLASEYKLYDSNLAYKANVI